MSRIYIAGKVTGEDPALVKSKFAIAQIDLINQGHIAVNPIDVVKDFNTPWDIAMGKCLKALLSCQTAYFLKDWKDSKGAKVEHAFAKELGLTIIYE